MPPSGQFSAPVTPTPAPEQLARIRVCPECAGPIAHNCACVTCLQCGWGRCG